MNTKQIPAAVGDLLPTRNDVSEIRELERSTIPQSSRIRESGEGPSSQIEGVSLDLLHQFRIQNFRLHGSMAEQRRQSAVIETLRKYKRTMLESFQRGEGLYFYGPCGTGKDHLAVAMMSAIEQALNPRRTCVYYGRFGLPFLRIAGEKLLDMSWSKNEEAKRNLINQMAGVDLLLVSDLTHPTGVSLADPEASLAKHVIQKRNESKRPTWFTINVEDENEADELLSTALFDRIRQNNLAIPCFWQSHRRFVELNISGVADRTRAGPMPPVRPRGA